MASAGARAYIGVWVQSPQRGPRAEPLVRGSEAERLFAFGHPMEAQYVANSVNHSFCDVSLQYCRYIGLPYYQPFSLRDTSSEHAVPVTDLV